MSPAGLGSRSAVATPGTPGQLQPRSVGANVTRRSWPWAVILRCLLRRLRLLLGLLVLYILMDQAIFKERVREERGKR